MSVPAADDLRRGRNYVSNDDLDALADLLEAIDALVVRYAAGPPEMAPLLNDLHRLLHPEVQP